MALSSGDRLGPYEVLVQIGAGGMGEVYRATDTRLKREVAIKVLPASLQADAERLARLQREAEVLASLNHPNIAQIYGLERLAPGRPGGQTSPTPDGGQTPQSGEVRPPGQALVLEYVDGPTLADRIAQGAMPVDDALPIAAQILDALDAAHRLGIVHRDLKPANVKVRPDGTVKVLDFGLAKALTSDGTGAMSAAVSSPTITTPAMTEMGVILGTAAYMAPEQAKGRTVDRRADLWAFGCVLFEMLTGSRAFGGEDVSDTLASVLKTDVDLDELPASVPSRLRQLVRACLRKDPKQRLDSAQDARLALEGAFETPAPQAPAPEAPASPAWRRMLPYAAAAVLTGLIVGAAAWALSPAVEPGVVSRFSFDLPEGQVLRNGRTVLAVSPNGDALVYATLGGLHLRAMDEMDPRLVAGTGDNLSTPFFSANGEWVAYGDADTLEIRRIAVSGGASVKVADVTRLFGASWGNDETLVFGQSDGIWRVPATGGTPEQVIAAEPEEQFFGPQVLPDGDTVLFTVTTGSDDDRWNEARIVAQSISSGRRTVLLEGGSGARYLPTGHLVYALESNLYGVRFDAGALEVIGGAVPLVQGVWQSGRIPTANWDVSKRGTLAYVADMVGGSLGFVWVRRDGATERVETVPGGMTPRLSPDGQRVLLEAEGDLWVYDLPTGRRSRLTSNGSSVRGAWDPSGTQVAFTLAGDGGQQAWITTTDGTGDARRVTDLEGSVHVDSWARDGSALAFHHHVDTRPTALRVLPLDPPGAEPQAFLEREYGAEGIVFSPDGRYVAYAATETDEREVFISPYPGPGGRVPVSVGGGQQPMWAANGELFYRDLLGERMMVVQVRTQPSLEVGTPQQLFQGAFVNTPPGGSPRPQYDVTADGQRFLMLQADTSVRPRIIVVQNWFEELERLIPVR